MWGAEREAPDSSSYRPGAVSGRRHMPAAPESAGAEDGENYVLRAREAFNDSTDYVHASVRADWERWLRLWQSRHAHGSKYLDPKNRFRSNLFRPKTRAAVKKAEAATAEAFFASPDAVTIAPTQANNKEHQASAAFWAELTNYRLGMNGNRRGALPWFLNLMGARQDCEVYNIAVARVWWRYETRRKRVWEPMTDEQGFPVIDQDGDELEVARDTEDVAYDQPWMTLIAPENFRFDPACDWTQIVESSPFTIEIIPMTVGAIKERMRAGGNPSGQQPWHHYEDAAIMQARTDREDSVRQVREDRRPDPRTDRRAIGDHEIVWVHHNIMRIDGQDMVWDTLGISFLLSDPVPLEEVYPQGFRPYVVGHSNIESHKTYPTSNVGLGEQVQIEANEVANMRLDNVKLAMMSRPKVVAGRNIDLDTVRRHAPGEPILVRDVKDVEFDRAPDVTASSYEEQNRINVDFDEIMGNFSNASVASNRQLNETVGGMRMLRSEGQVVGGYNLRIFTETFAEPVVRQIVTLEQMFESDLTLMHLAAGNANIIQRYGIDTFTDEILMADLMVRINVGLSSTDPQIRLDKWAAGWKTVREIYGPKLGEFTNAEEVITETFGIVGYKDALRFFNLGEDPSAAAQQAQIQQLREALQQKTDELEAQIKVAQIAAGSRVQVAQIGAQADLEEQRMESATDIAKEQLKSQAGARQQAQTQAGESASQAREHGQRTREALIKGQQQKEAQRGRQEGKAETA